MPGPCLARVSAGGLRRVCLGGPQSEGRGQLQAGEGWSPWSFQATAPGAGTSDLQDPPSPVPSEAPTPGSRPCGPPGAFPERRARTRREGLRLGPPWGWGGGAGADSAGPRVLARAGWCCTGSSTCSHCVLSFPSCFLLPVSVCLSLWPAWRSPPSLTLGHSSCFLTIFWPLASCWPSSPLSSPCLLPSRSSLSPSVSLPVPRPPPPLPASGTWRSRRRTAPSPPAPVW